MRYHNRLLITYLVTALVVLCALEGAREACAQQPPEPEPGDTPLWRHGPPPGFERFQEFAKRFRDGTHKNKEELAELIEVVRAWRMMKEVGLSEEQTLAALKLGRELKTHAGKIKKQREQALHELEKLLDDPDAKDAAIAKQLQRIDQLDERHRKLMRDYERRVRSGLTVRQQAKRELFKTRFEGDLRKHIEYIRRRHRTVPHGKQWEGKQRPPAPSPPEQDAPPPTAEPPAPD
jgi:hypothetical protein